MQHKNKLEFVNLYLVLVIVLGLIAVGANVYMWQKVKNEPVGSELEIITPNIQIPSSGFETYTHQGVPFTFKYPVDLVIKKDYEYKTPACQEETGCKGTQSIELSKTSTSKTLIGINIPQCAGVKSSNLLGNNWICALDGGKETLEAYDFIKNSFQQTTKNNLPIPGAPGLSFMGMSSDKPFVQINLIDWSIAPYFNIYRSTNNNGPWEKIISKFPQSAHTAVDFHYPKDAKILYYKITSVDKNNNESLPSQVSSVKIP